MALLFTEPTMPLRALELAAARGLLPTSLGSREIREAFTREMRRRSVFMARTTSAEFLSEVRTVVNSITGGDYNLATGRMVLRELLGALGYTPEGGFPEDVIGDGPGEVPEAVEGTLQDLRTRRRLDLVLRTQSQLMRGAGLMERGMEAGRMERYPAWELFRLGRREEPRVWQQRWQEVGGELADGGRMIALKTDGIWKALGSTEFYDDTLDTEHPPFAYNSGMWWREIGRAAYEAMHGPIVEVERAAAEPSAPKLPAAVATVKADDDFLQAIRGALGAHQAEGGTLTMTEVVDTWSE